MSSDLLLAAYMQEGPLNLNYHQVDLSHHESAGQARVERPLRDQDHRPEATLNEISLRGRLN